MAAVEPIAIHNLFRGSCWDVHTGEEVSGNSARHLRHLHVVPVNLEPPESISLGAALEHRCTELGIRFQQLPPVLVFHLERNMAASTTRGHFESHKKFTFPLDVNLRRYSMDHDNPLADSEAYDYTLRGVVVKGVRHYWSYVRCSPGWRLYDDSHTAHMEALPGSVYGGGRPESGSAYMLYYEQTRRWEANRTALVSRHGLANPAVNERQYCCYANSVLQQLLAIPEFRDVLLHWKLPDGDPIEWRQHLASISAAVTSDTAPDTRCSVKFLDAWQQREDAVDTPVHRNWRMHNDACEFFQELVYLIATATVTEPQPAVEPPEDLPSAAGAGSSTAGRCKRGRAQIGDQEGGPGGPGGRSSPTASPSPKRGRQRARGAAKKSGSTAAPPAASPAAAAAEGGRAKRPRRQASEQAMRLLRAVADSGGEEGGDWSAESSDESEGRPARKRPRPTRRGRGRARAKLRKAAKREASPEIEAQLGVTMRLSRTSTLLRPPHTWRPPAPKTSATPRERKLAVKLAALSEGDTTRNRIPRSLSVECAPMPHAMRQRSVAEDSRRRHSVPPNHRVRDPIQDRGVAYRTEERYTTLTSTLKSVIGAKEVVERTPTKKKTGKKKKKKNKPVMSVKSHEYVRRIWEEHDKVVLLRPIATAVWEAIFTLPAAEIPRRFLEGRASGVAAIIRSLHRCTGQEKIARSSDSGFAQDVVAAINKAAVEILRIHEDDTFVALDPDRERRRQFGYRDLRPRLQATTIQKVAGRLAVNFEELAKTTLRVKTMQWARDTVQRCISRCPDEFIDAANEAEEWTGWLGQQLRNAVNGSYRAEGGPVDDPFFRMLLGDLSTVKRQTVHNAFVEANRARQPPRPTEGLDTILNEHAFNRIWHPILAKIAEKVRQMWGMVRCRGPNDKGIPAHRGACGDLENNERLGDFGEFIKLLQEEATKSAEWHFREVDDKHREARQGPPMRPFRSCPKADLTGDFLELTPGDVAGWIAKEERAALEKALHDQIRGEAKGLDDGEELEAGVAAAMPPWWAPVFDFSQDPRHERLMSVAQRAPMVERVTIPVIRTDGAQVQRVYCLTVRVQATRGETKPLSGAEELRRQSLDVIAGLAKAVAQSRKNPTKNQQEVHAVEKAFEVQNWQKGKLKRNPRATLLGRRRRGLQGNPKGGNRSNHKDDFSGSQAWGARLPLNRPSVDPATAEQLAAELARYDPEEAIKWLAENAKVLLGVDPGVFKSLVATALPLPAEEDIRALIDTIMKNPELLPSEPPTGAESMESPRLVQLIERLYQAATFQVPEERVQFDLMLGRHEQWDAKRRARLGVDQVFTHHMAVGRGLRTGAQEPLREYIHAFLRFWDPPSGPSIKEYVVGDNRTLFKWRFRRQCAKRRHIAAIRKELLRWANVKLREEEERRGLARRGAQEGVDDAAVQGGGGAADGGGAAPMAEAPHGPGSGPRQRHTAHLHEAYGKKQKCNRRRCEHHMRQKKEDAELQPVLSAFGGGRFKASWKGHSTTPHAEHRANVMGSLLRHIVTDEAYTSKCCPMCGGIMKDEPAADRERRLREADLGHIIDAEKEEKRERDEQRRHDAAEWAAGRIPPRRPRMKPKPGSARGGWGRHRPPDPNGGPKRPPKRKRPHWCLVEGSSVNIAHERLRICTECGARKERDRYAAVNILVKFLYIVFTGKYPDRMPAFQGKTTQASRVFQRRPVRRRPPSS